MYSYSFVNALNKKISKIILKIKKHQKYENSDCAVLPHNFQNLKQTLKKDIL